MSASLACGTTKHTCKEKGANCCSTAGDGHADISLCEESARSLEENCERRTPLNSGVDEAVKGLCLQIAWLPLQ